MRIEGTVAGFGCFASELSRRLLYAVIAQDCCTAGNTYINHEL